MKNFLQIELAQLPRRIVVIVEGVYENEIGELASYLQSLDPDHRELKSVTPGSGIGCDALIYPTESSARGILNFIRAYVGTEKSRIALRRRAA